MSPTRRTTTPTTPKPAQPDPTTHQDASQANPSKRRPPADRARAQAFLAAGRDPSDVAAAIGVKVETIYKWRKKYNWPRNNDLQPNQPSVLNSGQHLTPDASDPRTAAVLVQHRAQTEALRRQLDKLLELDDLGAGPKGSVAQAAERVSAALDRLHRLDRQAHGMASGEQAQLALAVIVVPARSGSSADWSRDVREVVGAVADVTARAQAARRTGRQLPASAGGGSLVGARDLRALPPPSTPASQQDSSTAGPDPFRRDREDDDQ